MRECGKEEKLVGKLDNSTCSCFAIVKRVQKRILLLESYG